MMTSPKRPRSAEPPDEAPPAEDAVELIPEVVEPPGVVLPGAPISPIVRKGPGIKEVPAFRWKLVGESSSMVLTLFKTVEREEIDAHLDRVRKEGFYTNLRVLDINEKIAQPGGVKAAKTRAAAKSVTLSVKKPVPVGKAKSASRSSAAMKTTVAVKTVKLAKPPPAKRGKKKLAVKSGKATAGRRR